MIEREGKLIVVHCDSCPEVLETETSDFTEARAIMQREDWKVRQIAGEWLHGCPACGVPT